MPAPFNMGAPALSTSSAPTPPSELQLDEKWDKFIDLSLRRVVYGTLAGSLAALTILRGPTTRIISIAFGAGFGAGSAWQSCAKDFEHH